ncbi:SMI1/KNR4 family protein [Chitinophaga sp. RAB17]|uniref:SMI1/KNR4 family protein n=1 Tax=Chitinophaga sp. RAB17 TaxID=3233049 RepID=UPI003F8DE341
MKMNKREELEYKLSEETDGTKFSRLKDKLIKNFGESEREAVIQAFVRYAREGKLLHWRNFLMTDIIGLVLEGEEAYAAFFKWALTVPDLSYWAVNGYLKTAGKEAYPLLVTMAMSDEVKLEVRANAIKCLSVHSEQKFDSDLPGDPGYWKAEQLPLPALLKWQEEGYSLGVGYTAPATHPALQQPVTPLEMLAAKLEKQLAKYRKEQYDKANPGNLLVIANENDLARINEKWTLPETYALFLRDFSPLHVMLDGGDIEQGLHLYGAQELIVRQQGYAFNPVTDQVIQDWPPHLLVIADDGGDPYCLDLSMISNGDAPILFSRHGMGRWAFEEFAGSFMDFLKKITGI